MTRAIAVVGARLNSSRLPGKQLLDLAGRPLIERLFERLERVEGLDDVVLATTADAFNRPLLDWAGAGGRQVFAYAGDVDDLMGRVEAVVQERQPDILVYVCGDSPLIEPATLTRMLAALRRASDADEVRLAAPPDGRRWIHEGFDVFSRAFWTRMLAASNKPMYREHVGAVRREMTGIRSLTIEEDPVYAEIDHRLSVDTASDYAFMQRLYADWYAEHDPDSIVSLRWVIERLCTEPALSGINRDVRQKRPGETAGTACLVTQAGAAVGLGHLKRSLIAARVLQDRLGLGIEIRVAGEPVAHPQLGLLRHTWYPDPGAALVGLGEEEPPAVVLIDLPWAQQSADLADRVGALRRQGGCVIGIDAPAALVGLFDGCYQPTFWLGNVETDSGCLRYGWETYLLDSTPARSPWRDGRRVGVFTGGSDVARLGCSLPALLDAALPADARILWVQGPYAAAPTLPAAPRHDWEILTGQDSLTEVYGRIDYALTLYGVTLFELLRAGVSTVVFSPYGDRDTGMLRALSQEAVADVGADARDAVTRLARLMADPAAAAALAEAGRARLAAADGTALAETVRACCGIGP